MSDIEPNDLESIVNRYLDGVVTDEQLEAYLRGRHESVDFEQIRSFKSRVEKIEEIYRQLGEPEVPDGYWDSFADRVTARLPSTERRSLGNRIADILLPTRWPKAAFGYAGAIASIALVLVVGRSILESGKTRYEPTPSQEVAPTEEPQPTKETAVLPSTKAESEPSTTNRAENEVADKQKPEAKPTEAVRMESADRSKKEAQASIGEVTRREDKEPESVTPKTEATQSTAIETEEVAVTAPMEKREQGDISLNFQGTHPQTVSEDHIVTSSIIRDSARASESVKDLIQKKSPSELLGSSLKPSQRGTSLEMHTTDSNRHFWEYDSWSLERLRELYESRKADSAESTYPSPAYHDLTAILSSIALKSRDTADVDRALQSMDSLFKYNTDIDSARWIERRNILESIRIDAR